MCSDKGLCAPNLVDQSLTQTGLRLLIPLRCDSQFVFRLAKETDACHFRCCSISERASSMSRAAILSSLQAFRRRSASASPISPASSCLPG